PSGSPIDERPLLEQLAYPLATGQLTTYPTTLSVEQARQEVADVYADTELVSLPFPAVRTPSTSGLLRPSSTGQTEEPRQASESFATMHAPTANSLDWLNDSRDEAPLLTSKPTMSKGMRPSSVPSGTGSPLTNFENSPFMRQLDSLIAQNNGLSPKTAPAPTHAPAVNKHTEEPIEFVPWPEEPIDEAALARIDGRRLAAIAPNGSVDTATNEKWASAFLHGLRNSQRAALSGKQSQAPETLHMHHPSSIPIVSPPLEQRRIIRSPLPFSTATIPPETLAPIPVAQARYTALYTRPTPESPPALPQGHVPGMENPPLQNRGQMPHQEQRTEQPEKQPRLQWLGNLLGRLGIRHRTQG
ncbi:MAG TPA: hypothetical protein VKX46_03735, partial [Ktedonobacteraceae bacterium]|nr:hypothetical protein [Ktedonobacteraceae bacterium]